MLHPNQGSIDFLLLSGLANVIQIFTVCAENLLHAEGAPQLLRRSRTAGLANDTNKSFTACAENLLNAEGAPQLLRQIRQRLPDRRAASGLHHTTALSKR